MKASKSADPLRVEISSLCRRLDAGKVKCVCGGKARLIVENNGCCTAAFSQDARIVRSKCRVSTSWHNGPQFMECWDEWKYEQRRKRTRRAA